MIPRLLHYIWVGPEEIPLRSRIWIEQSAQLCPNYDLRVWREEDLGPLPPFAARAYGEKKWAFVSDYMRFKILRDQGGVYLDTDMQLLRPLDPLMDVPGFSGWNRSHTYIYCGLIGATPHHPFMKELVKAYDALPAGVYPTSPEMFTRTYLASTYQDFVIHPSSFFYPVSAEEKITHSRLGNAFATHHWDETWRTFVPLRRFLRHIGVMRIYHAIRGIE